MATKKGYKTTSGVIVISNSDTGKENVGFINILPSGKVLFDPAQHLFTSEDLRIVALILEHEQKEIDKFNMQDEI